MGGKRLTDKLNINKRRWRGGERGVQIKVGGLKIVLDQK